MIPPPSQRASSSARGLDARAPRIRVQLSKGDARARSVDRSCAAPGGKRNPGEIGGTLRDAGNVARPVPRAPRPSNLRAPSVRGPVYDPFDEFFPFLFSLSLSPVFCTRHLDFLGLRSFLLLDLEPRWERLWSPSWLAVGKGIVSCETFSFLIQASKGISMDSIPLENKN